MKERQKIYQRLKSSHHTTSPSAIRDKRSGEQVKIAYLVLTHKNPRLLSRVIRTLSAEHSTFFVHIDKKSNIKEFSGVGGGRVCVSRERISVYWGEFSVVRSVLLLLQQALDAPETFDYFILLSGSDYPLRDGPYIHSFLEENYGLNFISMVHIPNERAGMPLSRISRRRIESSRPVSQLAVRLAARLGLAERDYRKHLGSLEPYGGDMWWALTRAACEYLLEFVRRNPHVEEYFRSTTAPDEMFVHTVLGNSAFASRMRRNLHYEDWSSPGSHPAMINDQHLGLFEAREKVCLNDIWGSGEVLFARKFSDDSLNLLDRLDDMIERKGRC